MKYPVIEIDGPPMAYFEGINRERNFHRYCYKKISIHGHIPELIVIELFNYINNIKKELEKTEGSIIYWRSRPALTRIGEEDFYRASCRLYTSPEINYLNEISIPEDGFIPVEN